MTKSIGFVVVCLLGLVGCSVERYDDCDDDYYDHDDDDRPPRPVAGSSSTGGKSSGGNGGNTSGGRTGGESSGGSANAGSGGGGSDSGGSAGSAGTAGSGPSTTCELERDCPRGYNCDLEQHECVRADAETCPELESEAACTNRRDCVPIYGGINCSCGQDCECKGGDADVGPS
jgi:hypothetical protein